MHTPGGTRSNQGLVLTAMIFAVAMTFIDQTIVSIAAPKIQEELGLSSTGLQWAVNSYLLALAAFFALGGRLADTLGHRPMVITGIVIFAVASALCGFTPKGSIAEAWLVTFRAVQGVGGALMYPAALAIVVSAYPIRERGKALALFFGIAGGLTAIGPAAGGYLTLWTWRAIFWINIPVAIVALVLIAISKPTTQRVPARIDYRGAALIIPGVGLSVFGFQQSAQWGWKDPATAICIVVGFLLLLAFVRLELRTTEPLMNVRIFRDRVFLLDNVILAIAMTVFVPIFFFASIYSEIALGEKATVASLTLLYFFIGFVVAAQIGGRMLDRVGARRPIVLGCALACVALALWAGRVTTLSIGQQVWCIVLAGAGMGLMLGQANTDALNRAPSTAYGEATGITQTVRNYGASLGLAVLGTILTTVVQSKLPAGASVGGGLSEHASGPIPHFVQVAFADGTRVVLYIMCGVMGLACLIALRGLPRGAASRVQERRAEIGDEVHGTAS
jgi:EmrB/QacA subfamily drug resistance transporter